MRSRNVRILLPILFFHPLLRVPHFPRQLVLESSHLAACPFQFLLNHSAQFLQAVLFPLLCHLKSFISDKFRLPVVFLLRRQVQFHHRSLLTSLHPLLSRLHLFLRDFRSSKEGIFHFVVVVRVSGVYFVLFPSRVVHSQ